MTGDDAHHVLWTGGWDSTFRVADLVLTHGRTVQPIYVWDERRRTARTELRRMSELVQAMDAHQPGASALVRPVHVLDADTIPRDPEVDAAIDRVTTSLTIYEQYHYLPHVPTALRRDGIELCWQNDGTFAYFPPSAYRAPESPRPYDALRLDESSCDPDRFLMFRRFSFPVITVTKPAMAAIARERGFLPILEQTWTCRWPTVFGNPCGFCTPCQHTRSEGLAHRVPQPTRLRRLAHQTKWATVRRGQEVRIRLHAARRAIGGGSDG